MGFHNLVVLIKHRQKGKAMERKQWPTVCECKYLLAFVHPDGFLQSQVQNEAEFWKTLLLLLCC